MGCVFNGTEYTWAGISISGHHTKVLAMCGKHYSRIQIIPIKNIFDTSTGIILLLFYDPVHPCMFTELSNLIVMRKGMNGNAKPLSETFNLCQLRFHQIKDKEIIQVSFNSTPIKNAVVTL